MAQRLELKDLEKLLKALKDSNKPFIRIGILGSDASAVHKPEGDESEGAKSFSTNAEIGAAHEYGTIHLPVRSFLRLPLSNNLNKALGSAGAFTKDTMQEVLKLGTITPWLLKVQTLAEGVVLESFNTGGDGQWPESNMARKKVQQTLVETQQLRNSISSEIKKNG